MTTTTAGHQGADPKAKAKALQAKLAKHRTGVLVGAAGAVSALGLYAHHKNAVDGTPTPGATPAVSGTDTGATVAGVGNPGSVDTSGTDVYDALQPQLAQQQSLLAQLLAYLQGDKTPGKAKPKPKPKPAPPGMPHGTPRRPPLPHSHPDHHHHKPIKKPPKGPGHKTPHRQVYVVRRGDNLTTIAHHFHTSWGAIYKANRATIGRNPNHIRAGMHLVIP